jgi:hypothetical protein
VETPERKRKCDPPWRFGTYSGSSCRVAGGGCDLALGVTVDGTRDVLGLWAGGHGDGEG